MARSITRVGAMCRAVPLHDADYACRFRLSLRFAVDDGGLGLEANGFRFQLIQQFRCAGTPSTLPTDSARAITRWQIGQTLSGGLSLRVMPCAMRRPFAHVVRGARL